VHRHSSQGGRSLKRRQNWPINLWSRKRASALQRQGEALRPSLATRGLSFTWHPPLLQLHGVWRSAQGVCYFSVLGFVDCLRWILQWRKAASAGGRTRAVWSGTRRLPTSGLWYVIRRKRRPSRQGAEEQTILGGDRPLQPRTMKASGTAAHRSVQDVLLGADGGVMHPLTLSDSNVGHNVTIWGPAHGQDGDACMASSPVEAVLWLIKSRDDTGTVFQNNVNCMTPMSQPVIMLFVRLPGVQTGCGRAITQL
jgi:hypothetical protein